MSDGDEAELDPRPGRRTITIYDLATGAPRYVTQTDEGREGLCCGDGEGWVEGTIDPDLHRVDPASGQLVALLEFDLTITTNSVAGIPAGTTAIWRLSRAVVDDGTLEFETEGLPEDVQVRLMHPAYHPIRITVPCA